MSTQNFSPYNGFQLRYRAVDGRQWMTAVRLRRRYRRLRVVQTTHGNARACEASCVLASHDRGPISATLHQAACFVVWRPRRAADSSTNRRQGFLCRRTTSMEHAADTAEAIAVNRQFRRQLKTFLFQSAHGHWED